MGEAMKITFDSDADIGIIFEEKDSTQLRGLMEKWLVPTLLKFAAKNKGYEEIEGYNYSLGSKGEFVEIFRKTGKLHRGIWDGNWNAFKSESPYEVSMDMIGDLLLLMDAVSKENS
jgi:hypothetical protein